MVWKGAWRTSAARAATTGNERVSALAIMGGVVRGNNSQAFEGGDLTAIMGGCEIDLRQASIRRDEAVIDVFAFWGGIDIKVPEDWTVMTRVTPLMGGVEDKTRAATQPPAGKRLVLRGIVIMGGIVGEELIVSCIPSWRGQARLARRNRASGCRSARCSPRCSALQGVLVWIGAAIVAVPLSIAYGFLCLSAWYVTGGSPVDRVGPLRVGATAVVAAVPVERRLAADRARLARR